MKPKFYSVFSMLEKLAVFGLIMRSTLLFCLICLFSTVNLIAQGPEISIEEVKGSTCGNGIATIAPRGANGPFSINWSTGVINEHSITDLEAGIYSVTVTDANNVSVSASIEIPMVSPAQIVILDQPATNCSGSNGSILIDGVGTPPFDFSWSDGSTSKERMNIAIGTYNVTMTDGNGCTVSQSIEIKGVSITNNLSFSSQLDTAKFGLQFTPSVDIEGDYLWTFGDGSYSIEREPFYRYKNTGEYIATLSIINTCDTVFASKVIAYNSPYQIVLKIGESCEIEKETVRVPVIVNSPFTFTLASIQATFTIDPAVGSIKVIEPAAIQDYLYNPETRQFSSFKVDGYRIQKEMETVLVFLVIELSAYSNSQQSDIFLNDVEIGIIKNNEPQLLNDYFLLPGSVRILDMLNVEVSVHTMKEEGINNVEVEFVNTDAAIRGMTDATGEAIMQVRPKRVYQMEVSKEGKASEGLSTYALWLLQRFLVGLPTAEEINSPAQLIAGDVDCNGRVTVFDLLNIQRVLVGLDNSFICPIWKFFSKEALLKEDLSPNNVLIPSSSMELPNMLIDSIINLIGIKTGDILGKARFGFRAAESEARSYEQLSLIATPTITDEGQVIEFILSLEEAKEITDFQIDIGYDNQVIELIEVTDFKKEISNTLFGSKDNNQIILSYFNPDGEGIKLKEEEELFKLRFKLYQPVNNSDQLIWIDTKGSLLPVAHCTANKAYNIQLQIPVTQEIISNEIGQLLVEPNPTGTRNNTTVAFQLPTAADGHLLIYDLQGSQVSSKSSLFEKGINRITLNHYDLPNEGTYILVLKTKNYLARTKLVVTNP